MHPEEVATICAFVVPAQRERWLGKLASRHRRSFLGRLNHCHDLDERYAILLASSVDVLAALRKHGAPATCRVISDVAELDGREMPLDEAIDQTGHAGFGALVCCIPGRLAYYQGEAGTRRRLLLERLDPA